MFNRFYTPQELSQLRVSDNKIFGEPGASLPAVTENLNNHKGHYGEQIIGNILNLLATEIPGLYVCHSIGMPEGFHGETDHVLIYKNKVILVETKAFSGYTAYSVNKEGYLKASKGHTRKIRVNDSNAFEKVSFYQQFFTNRQVQCILAVTRDQVKTYSENNIYKVASLDNIMSVVRDEIAEAEEIKEPDWPAVKFFASLCIAPQIVSVLSVMTGPTKIIDIEEQREKRIIRSNGKHLNRIHSR